MIHEITIVIHALEGRLVLSKGVFLQPSSSNAAEYSTKGELLRDAISKGIWYREVHLDLQLVVS